MLFQRTVANVDSFRNTVARAEIVSRFPCLRKARHSDSRQTRREDMARMVRPCRLLHNRFDSGEIVGTGSDVHIPECVKASDYEFEIGCYVTKSALLTDEKEALQFFKDHCYLTIVNDWSARDIQKKDMDGLGPSNSKFIIGKSIGPKFVKASEFEDGRKRRIRHANETDGQRRN